jgi:hypothetical protein
MEGSEEGDWRSEEESNSLQSLEGCEGRMRTESGGDSRNHPNERVFPLAGTGLTVVASFGVL